MAFGWGSLLCAPTLQSLGLGGGFWGESIHFGGESVGENAPLGGENAPLGGESAHFGVKVPICWVKVPVCWVKMPILGSESAHLLDENAHLLGECAHLEVKVPIFCQSPGSSLSGLAELRVQRKGPRCPEIKAPQSCGSQPPMGSLCAGRAAPAARGCWSCSTPVPNIHSS